MSDRIVGKWWFEWLGVWGPRGNYATQQEALDAALAFHDGVCPNVHATLAVGQWAVGLPMPGEPTTYSAKQWHELRTARDNGGK